MDPKLRDAVMAFAETVKECQDFVSQLKSISSSAATYPAESTINPRGSKSDSSPVATDSSEPPVDSGLSILCSFADITATFLPANLERLKRLVEAQKRSMRVNPSQPSLTTREAKKEVGSDGKDSQSAGMQSEKTLSDLADLTTRLFKHFSTALNELTELGKECEARCKTAREKGLVIGLRKYNKRLQNLTEQFDDLITQWHCIVGENSTGSVNDEKEKSGSQKAEKLF